MRSDNAASQGKDQPLEADVLAAVRRSGYLMDQEVATVLEDLGFHVQTSWPFEDPDEGHSRELDVWAIRQLADDVSPVPFAELFCECKSGEDKPLVFLSRRKGEIDKNIAPCHHILPYDEYEQSHGGGRFSVHKAFNFFELRDDHYWFAEPTKAVQLAKIVRHRDKWEAQHDNIYNALLMPLAKALTHRKTQKRKFKHPLCLCFPLVVVRSPLYNIDVARQPLVPERVPFISFYRKLDATSVKGDYLVDFVTLDALPTLISEKIMPFAEAVVAKVRSNPQRVLK